MDSIEFKGSCLKQEKTTVIHINVVNFLIVFKLDPWSRDLNIKFTLNNYLFGAVKWTKNADSDKWGYNGYVIGFDVSSNFSIKGEWGKNDIIFWMDNSLPVHTDNRKKKVS